MIQTITLRVTPREAAEPELLRAAVAAKAGIAPAAVNDMQVRRRSIDARQRRVMVNVEVDVAWGDDATTAPLFTLVEFRPVAPGAPQIVIVGAGPAGLFAALRAIEFGIRPVVIERGKGVDERRLDLVALNREGRLDPDSNYCFGEGGAGTFSDGKLFTRSRKRGNVGDILELLCQHGARESILVDAHPHIGSDRLPHVIKAIRATILANGGDVRFRTRASGLITEGGRVRGVVTSEGEEFLGEAVVLATGHSARDVYRFLSNAGIRLEAKGFAMGVRLEHPQHIIDCLQYHDPKGRGRWLPPAEYSFVMQADGRGVYSFCMCPGGVIVPAESGPNQLVVNGMSASARAGRWANSGMVVEIRPGDFPEYEQYGELQLMHLQEDLERRFHEHSVLLNAPAQRMLDFTEGRESSSLPATSYVRGIHGERMDKLLPPFIAARLRKGFMDFGRRSRGFLTNDAVMIGLESRTSSPVRIPRDSETLCHPECPGLYPAGEGAGFAGGIVSAAIDGRRCVDAIAVALHLPVAGGNPM